MSRKRKQHLSESAEERHTIEFSDGQAVVALCSHLGRRKKMNKITKTKGIAMSEAEGGVKTRITATLAVRQWALAVEFYKAAFGATELHRVPGGGVAQLSVGGAEFWVAEESKEHLNFSPESLGGCSVRMLLIVEDPAGVCERAVAAGATQVYPVADAHGWRIGRIVDPAGHHWEVAKKLTCG